MRLPSRVLFVLNALAGGATRSAIEIMGALRAHGIECYAVYTPPATRELELLEDVCSAAEPVFMPWWKLYSRDPLWRRPLQWANRMRLSGFHAASSLQVLRWARRWNVDLIHSNTMLTLEGGLAASADGIPHVWHVRELVGKDGASEFPLPRPALRHLFNGLSDRIVANSTATAEPFHGLPSLVTVKNAVRIDEFEQSPEVRERARALRRAWGFGDDDLVVGMCGSLRAHWKRHDVFLQAAQRIAPQVEQARFVICGSLPDSKTRSDREHAARLRRLSTTPSLEGRLNLVGHVTDVPAMMGAIDVLAHSSPAESFGRVAAEAMAASKPVVGVAAGGLLDIIVDGETGYLTRPDSPSSMAEAVIRLLSDQRLRNRLGRAGLERARAEFALPVLTERILQVYEAAQNSRKAN